MPGGAAGAARAGSPVDSALAVLSVSGGAARVDLPRFGRAAEDVGWRPQAVFAAGLTLRRWCEPFAELSYTYLPGPDSVRTVSDQDTVLADMGTLTQVQAGVRIRPHSQGAWQPFAVLAAGAARLSVAAPGSFDARGTDAVWSAGGGLEWWARRHWLVRGEARYTGQRTASGTRAHLALQAGLGWVFGRDMRRLQ